MGNDDAAYVTIGDSNSAPVVSDVVVRSSTDTDGDMDDSTAIGSDSLECTYVYNDPDSDPDYSNISWSDGAGSFLGSGALLAGPFVKNDLITCTVTANDGVVNGNDDAATMLIQNAAPTASGVTVLAITDEDGDTDNTTAIAGDTLECSWVYDDFDGDADASTVAWTDAGGASIGSGTQLSGAFAKGDVVTCTVTANDGVLSGTSDSASLTIGNTAPSVVSVSIQPDPATDLDTLTAVAAGWDDVDGDTEGYLYEWTVNSSPVGASTPTLDASYTAEGDDVVVTITPFDGQLYGTPVSSAGLSIGSSCSPGAVWTQRNELCVADYHLVGEAAANVAGWSVASAGDVDADGYDDLLVSAHWNNDGGSKAGKIYLLLGASLGGASTLDLSTADYAFVGENPADMAGISVASAGDVDDDGRDDLLFGAPSNADGGTGAGKAYLVLGASLGATSTIDLATADYAFVGESTNDAAGTSVASAGDVDGDDLDDLLIGASLAGSSSQGKAYLVLGASLGGVSSIDLSTADYHFTGIAAGDSAGGAVASAGDVDGDGLDDVLIGARQADTQAGLDVGHAYVVLGASLGATAAMDLGAADFVLTGVAAGDAAGVSVAGIRDVDIDGLDDIIVGALSSDAVGSGAGAAYVVLGKSLTTPLIELSTADYTFVGEANGDNAGVSVAGAGDVDGDAIPDILIGANDAGYLILASSLGAVDTIDLAAADYAFTAENTNDYAGNSVASAGDSDGDGLADLLIGAWGNSENGSQAGKAYLLLSQFNAPPLAPGVVLSPASPNENNDLVCSVSTPAVDPDGDAITGYSFYIFQNRTELSQYTATSQTENDTVTVPASETVLGDEWACVVFAEDSVALGPGQFGVAEVEIGLAVPTTGALTAVADAYVSSASTSTNYGSASELIVDRSNTQVYLKFDLSGIPAGATIDDVRLTMTAYQGYAYGGDGNVYIRFVSDDSWTETGITYNNAPAYDPLWLGYWWLWYNTTAVDRVGELSNEDLRVAVENEYLGDQIISFHLSSPGYRTNYRTRTYSDSTQRPQLIVTYTQ